MSDALFVKLKRSGFQTANPKELHGAANRINRSLQHRLQEMRRFGESSFDHDVLNELYTECKNKTSAISLEISEAEQRILTLNEAAETFKKDYCKVLSWSEAYKDCTIEGKKMIIRQLIKKICVSRDYAT